MLCNTSLTITGAQCNTWTIFLQELNLQNSHQHQVSSPTPGNLSWDWTVRYDVTTHYLLQIQTLQLNDKFHIWKVQVWFLA